MFSDPLPAPVARYLPPQRRPNLGVSSDYSSFRSSSILSSGTISPSPSLISQESSSLSPVHPSYQDERESHSLARRIEQALPPSDILTTPSETSYSVKSSTQRSTSSRRSERPIYLPPHLRQPITSPPLIPRAPSWPRSSPHSLQNRASPWRPRPLGRPRTLLQGLDTHIDTFTPSEYDGERLPPARITNLHVAGGYKWIAPLAPLDGPTIVVPGIPDVWVGRNISRRRIQRDAELPGNVEFADYNAASVPEGYDPLEPVFQALNSPAELRDVQILTGRSNLKKLFAFCLATSNPRYAERPLRINASVLPGTDLVILHRWEPPRASEPREPSNWHLAYHEANTVEIFRGAERTSGCHRVVKYKWGGMGMMVKSDVGAGLPWPGLEVVLDDTSSYASETDDEEEEDDEEDDTMSIDTTLTSYTTFTPSLADTAIRETQRYFALSAKKTLSSGITVIPTIIPPPPQGHLISLKTRQVDSSPLHPLDLGSINHIAEVYAGMFFAQIPTLHLARHSMGTFAPEDQKFLLGQGELGKLGERFDGTMRMVRKIAVWMVRTTKKMGQCGFVAVNGEVRAYKWVDGPKKLSEESWDVIRQAGIARPGM